MIDASRKLNNHVTTIGDKCYNYAFTKHGFILDNDLLRMTSNGINKGPNATHNTKVFVRPNKIETSLYKNFRNSVIKKNTSSKRVKKKRKNI